MESSLVINACPSEVRVALLENGLPVEVYIERTRERGVIGNIYRGRVVRVLPGMQAAFVDIGLERTAFLYVNDAVLRPERTQNGDDVDDEAKPLAETADTQRGFRAEPLANISDVLTQGETILVQVQKEPIGTKGARLTRRITIPGRCLVFMPFAEHIGVSHRIADPTERERLREALAPCAPEGTGFIVRTAAEGVESARLEREAKVLLQLWQDICARGDATAPKSLVFADLDLALRTTRDLFAGDVASVVVDDAASYERIMTFVRTIEPGGESCVELYQGTEPIFDHFGVEVEVERALERRVWLKSGGYIVVDQAEALTVIDVNSGRFVGKSSLEDTITQINLEAVKEIAYQLRLRNIGGIVIIDFIDMALAENRDKVLGALEEALRRDRAKTTIVRMSEIGLVEMTRKRVRDSLGHTLTEPCPYCKARGYVKSEQTVTNEILRAIERSLAGQPAKTVLINMSPDVADYVYANEGGYVEVLEETYETTIIPVAREGYHREHYELVKTPRGRHG